MAKNFRDTPPRFDKDLDTILDRLYGQSDSVDLSQRLDSIPQTFVQHARGSQELKQALAKLRDARERSQGIMRMKHEIDDLKHQIAELKRLTQNIETLRRQLENDEEPP